MILCTEQEPCGATDLGSDGEPLSPSSQAPAEETLDTAQQKAAQKGQRTTRQVSLCSADHDVELHTVFLDLCSLLT